MIADIAGSIATDPSPADPTVFWLALAAALALAMMGIRKAFTLSGRRLAGYVTGLVVCAAIGVWGAIESDGYASLGLAVGLAASVLGARVLGAIDAKMLRRGK